MTASTVKMTDKDALHIGVDTEARANVAEHLSRFLATTYTLYFKTLYYHWNVTGPHFHALHLLFEEQYQDLQQAGDALAERIRALGHFSPGTYREFEKLSAVSHDESLPKKSANMVQNLLRDNEICTQEARKVLEAAEKAGDEVTVDMMVGRMGIHEKAAWMLRSTVE
ncbi:MAG: DNA starvation/stationary phase protection protein [Rickettsiales bacterium]